LRVLVTGGAGYIGSVVVEELLATFTSPTSRARTCSPWARWRRRKARVVSTTWGSGSGYSVREVVAAAEEVTGRRVPTRLAPRRAGDPAVLVASSERIRAELRWHPASRTCA
jgi:UDP-glucose 4-epimerase